MPRIPFLLELVYAVSTGVTYHMGVVEAQNVKPAYFTFMKRITGGKYVYRIQRSAR
jgi:hypothetical protein